MLGIRQFVLFVCCLCCISMLQAETVQCEVPAVSSPTKVNINTATAEQLSAGLKGIGKAKAAAIIEWRTLNGSFKSLEDLDEVKGIGAGLIEKNRELVVFADE